MKFEVTVTRTQTVSASFEVTAKDAGEAEQKVREKLDPPYVEGMVPDAIEKRDKAAARYWTKHEDSSTEETSFEYDDVSEV